MPLRWKRSGMNATCYFSEERDRLPTVHQHKTPFDRPMPTARAPEGARSRRLFRASVPCASNPRDATPGVVYRGEPAHREHASGAAGAPVERRGHGEVLGHKVACLMARRKYACSIESPSTGLRRKLSGCFATIFSKNFRIAGSLEAKLVQGIVVRGDFRGCLDGADAKQRVRLWAQPHVEGALALPGSRRLPRNPAVADF